MTKNKMDEEFDRCWIAAGLHLQKQAQDSMPWWIRNHLNPPIVEHLSFRIGNQLFFIRIEDKDNRLTPPGTLGGLIGIADGSDGRACLMPMHLVAGDWVPAESGWGLIDALTRLSIDPLALISEDFVEISDLELHDLAVKLVMRNISKDGRKLISWNADPDINPSLWFEGDSGGPEWVAVQALRYPKKATSSTENLDLIRKQNISFGPNGHFASVVVANSNDPFDPMAEKYGNFIPVIRDQDVTYFYAGLQKIPTTKINENLKSDSSAYSFAADAFKHMLPFPFNDLHLNNQDLTKRLGISKDDMPSSFKFQVTCISMIIFLTKRAVREALVLKFSSNFDDIDSFMKMTLAANDFADEVIINQVSECDLPEYVDSHYFPRWEMRYHQAVSENTDTSLKFNTLKKVMQQATFGYENEPPIQGIDDSIFKELSLIYDAYASELRNHLGEHCLQ
jgi:hypothetical protein